MKRYLSIFFLLLPLVLFGDTINGGRSFTDGGTFFPNQELVYKDCKFECSAGLNYNLKYCECKDCCSENKGKCPKMRYKDKNKGSARASLLMQKVYTPGEKEMRVKGKVVHIKDHKEDIVTDCKGKQRKLRVTATATFDPDNAENNTIKYRIKELQ